MDASWAPYEKTRMYPIPDTIYEQFNLSQVNTAMGLFAELNHAWVYIDNALYLWDYTQTNPEIVGYEEQPNSITAVKLIVPKAGVFTSAITHLLVVATTLDIQLIGVSASQGPTGARTVSLYATGMSQSIKGITVNKIEGSRSNGRIFFAGMDNDVYELTYQQEERWFANRCSKINHTSPAYTTLLPVTPFALGGRRSTERIVEMVVDDTRNLLYTLSTESAIRTFHMDSPTTLALAVTKSRLEILRDISHMIGQTPLLTNSIKIVSINTIPSSEAAKLHLMAVTSTGCRLFLSATRGYGSLAGRGEAPTSMQVQHIKFPPREQSQPQARPNGQFGQATSYQGAGADAAIDTQSRALELSREGHRFPPGLFLCYVSRQENRDNDVLFLSAPDTGRIAYAAREVSAQGTKFYEQGLWMSFDSHVEDIGLVTKPFGARSTPLGFGNELAVQFDDPSPEIALLTNTGVHTIRRRRLVDIFCAAIRYGTGEEGLADMAEEKLLQLLWQ
jgi:nuclear pore complex protein Nup155